MAGARLVSAGERRSFHGLQVHTFWKGEFQMVRFYQLLCVAALLGAGATAYADTFSFQFTMGTSGVIGSGTITATPDASIAGAFDVTDISGSYGGTAITGPLPCSTYSPSDPCTTSSGNTFDYDNLLYPSGVSSVQVTEVDHAGIGFLLGGIPVGVGAASTHTVTFLDSTAPAGAPPISATFTVSPTPEPSSVALLGSGVLGIALSLRRRVKSVGATKDN
jgi:PEP-CTERM motif